MKFRISIARAILFLSLILIGVPVANEASGAYLAYRSTREIIQVSETETTRISASMIHQIIRQQSFAGIQTLLPEIQSKTNADILVILNPQGEILAGYPAGASPHTVDGAFLQSVIDRAEEARWLEDQKTLQIGVSIYIEPNSDPLILLREVNLQPALNRLLESIYIRLAVTLVTVLVMAAILLWLNWRLAVQPMKEIAKAAGQATAGDYSPRVGRMIMVELDNIGQGLNNLLNRIQAQTTQLEGLNSGLEATVNQRTAELRTANEDLLRQADKLHRQAAGLQALNRILNAATSFNHVQELAEIALSEIITAMGADFGRLRILSAEAFFPPGDNPLASSELAVPNLLHHIAGEGARAGLVVPVSTQGKVAGRILLSSKQDNLWDEEDEALLNLIGQQLGAAAERIQAYDLSRETNRLMSRLIQVSEQLNQQLSFDEMVALIGISALELTSAGRGAFLLIGQDDRLIPIWHRGIGNRFIRELVGKGRELGAFTPPGDSNPVQVPNLELLADRQRSWWRENGEGIHSLAMIPLVYEGRLSACLVSFYPEADTPGLTHFEILETFARQAAIALENARLIEAERQQHGLAEALLDVSAALSSTLDPDEIFERILVNLEHVIHHDAASIMLVEGDELRVIRAKGYPTPDGQPVKRAYPLKMFPEVVRMSQTGLVTIIPNTRTDPDWVNTPGTSWIQAYAGAPVRSRGSLVGVINLLGRQPEAFTPEQAPILQAFASQAVLALDNARQYQATLRDRDETDSLYRALTDLLSAGGNVDEIARKIVQTVTIQLHIGHCALALVDQSNNKIKILHEAGTLQIHQAEIALDGIGLTPSAVRSGLPIYTPDVSRDPRYLKGSDKTRTELVIPLLTTSGEVFALVNMEDEKVDAFDEHTRRTLTNFSSRAALVLENGRLLDAAREQTRRTGILNQISQAALGAGGLDLALGRITRLVTDLVQADHCTITLVDEITGKNTAYPPTTVENDVTARVDLGSYEAFLTQEVLERSDIVVIEDSMNQVHPAARLSARFGHRSLLGVPLIADEICVGVILVSRAQPGPFEPDVIDRVRQAALPIALGVAKIRLLETTRMRFEESEKLRQATAALTTQLNFDQITALIADHLPRLLRFETLALFLVRDGTIKPVLALNLPLAERLETALFPIDDPIFQQLAEHGQPIVLADAQVDPRFRNWGGQPAIRSWAVVPLLSGEQIFGLIEIGRLQIDPFSPNELLLLQVFAHQAGSALQNAILHGVQQQLAITDPLTGLYNRRGFLELARHELERSWRFYRPLCLLIADIDHFKAVNDTYGHVAGDAVLTQLAATMRSTLREVDLTCRFGGEEFCVVLPESDPQGALQAAERLRQAVQTAVYHYRDIDIQITISIGMANLTSLNQSLEELIENADRALLTSKEEGRNRITVA